MIKAIAFDGDDTLWHHENIFLHTKEKFRQIMTKYGAGKDAIEAVNQAQIDNLGLYGYGIKGFTLSMLEESVRMSDGQLSADDVMALLNCGKDMLRSPVVLCQDVKEIVKYLYDQRKYKLFIITKGDLFDQESKIERSGLSKYFDVLEIVSEKNEETYGNILKELDIKPSEFMMVGNSVKSDVAPVISIGGNAVHVPYFTTWGHEKMQDDDLNEFPVIKTLAELPDILKEIE